MRRLALLVTLLVVALILIAFAGGAIQWNREAPYRMAQAWGAEGSGPGQFHEPTGLAVSPDEVFVADARNRRIQVLGLDGAYRREFGAEVLERPMNLSWRSGRLYIADFFADAILVFTGQGTLVQRIEAADGLSNPGGVDAFADGTVLVADTYKHRVVKLAVDGRVLGSWGRVGEVGMRAGRFNYPTDVVIRPDGGFYVADGYNDRIQQFGADGQFVRRWGGPFGLNVSGPYKGWFATASSVAVVDQSVFVADFHHDRVQKFDLSGRYLTSFGLPPPGALTHSALAVAAGDDASVWVSNFARHRVERWVPAN